ncbi:MAG TPA: MFS transporter [Vicinamibacterales bacterium]|nr:MFS transporter [Vicinamibacterales bacterium]
MNVGATVVLLGVTSLFADISSEMISATLPLFLLMTLRFSPFAIGVADGIYQGAAVLVRVLSGVASDRWRRPKDIATCGYGLSALSRLALIVAGVGGAAPIFGAIVVDRIGKGIRTAPRDAMIAASSPRGMLATSFGVHRAMDTAGAMLGPLFAFALLTVVGPRFDAIFVVSFCVAVVGVAVIALFVRNPDQSVPGDDDRVDAAESPAPAAPTFADGITLFREPAFRTVILVGSALSLITVSDGLLYLALRQRVGIQPNVFPLLYVVTALAFMTLAIPVGRLADRIGHEVTFVLGYGLLAVVYALLLLPHPNAFVAMLLLVMLGAYYAATDGVLMALASSMLPSELRATGLAVLTTGTGLARLIASALYGALWAWLGIDRTLAIFTLSLCSVLWIARRTIVRTSR